MKYFVSIVFILSTLLVFSQTQNANKLLFADNFDKDISNWIVEFEKPATSTIQIIHSKLDVSSSAGATIWFKHKLSGNVIITYDAIVIDAGGVSDRVSDFNAFWMASDPTNVNPFNRNGKFTSYDNLNLYYAGVGGNTNTTTRFRKYHSNGVKPVLKEFLDKEHLLTGNRFYKVKIIVNNGHIQYFRDETLYWDYLDETPYKEGWFGFRTTTNHVQFSNFKVFKID
jgi:hypothetical protein